MVETVDLIEPYIDLPKLTIVAQPLLVSYYLGFGVSGMVMDADASSCECRCVTCPRFTSYVPSLGEHTRLFLCYAIDQQQMENVRWRIY